MKRLDIIVRHEQVGKVSDSLRKNDVGGLTFYDIRGRGRSKYEPEHVGTGVMEYVPDFGPWTKSTSCRFKSKADCRRPITDNKSRFSF
jgi:nitrogen regulatory protein P-II 1